LNIKSLLAPPQVVLSWTNAGVPFLLQSNNNLAQPTNWQTFTPVKTVVGGQTFVTNGATGPPAFFRLQTP
jgi:hypothetical protein